VQFRISDNGQGIPRKVLRRIYEPYFSHGKKKGTGLGMATIKKIVAEHGGTVEIHTEEGMGTTVLVTIPDFVDPLNTDAFQATTGAYRSLKQDGA
jgi:signal transduction histidine kinase